MALADVIRGAHAAARRLIGREVTYRRGESAVVVTAVIGETVFRVQDESGIEQRFTRRDYLIDAAELELDGSVVEPQAGDQIEEVVGAETLTFEVMGPGGGEPDWRYSDPERTTLRVHTKHVKTEAV